MWIPISIIRSPSTFGKLIEASMMSARRTAYSVRFLRDGTILGLSLLGIKEYGSE